MSSNSCHGSHAKDFSQTLYFLRPWKVSLIACKIWRLYNNVDETVRGYKVWVRNSLYKKFKLLLSVTLIWRFCFNFKSQGTEKIQLFSQGTDGSINLRYESLFTVDDKYEEILLLAFLDVKLWLEEGDY